MIDQLKKEPALLGTMVAAILPVAIICGLDPETGGAIGTMITVLVGVWIRSKVSPVVKA